MSSPIPTPNAQLFSTTENPLVVFNITAQINEKLTPSTFPQWHAQFEALLIGYDLMDYVDGTSQCPSSDDTPSSSKKKKKKKNTGLDKINKS
ncbi:hypothetical protein Pint_10413 [Pistacia integerrima]|uniref:Uncharacterized protein n=1 Tax=Pistacia integerrima TaxID=434235 RepID=A0ACC0XG16_9ROSI|nr:hypothetical protein Pint_10413 [Pistacia integerrima]